MVSLFRIVPYTAKSLLVNVVRFGVKLPRFFKVSIDEPLKHWGLIGNEKRVDGEFALVWSYREVERRGRSNTMVSSLA